VAIFSALGSKVMCRASSLAFASSLASVRRREPKVFRYAASEETAVWKEAYELELERNSLLRDQLKSVGFEEDDQLPEIAECTIDWSENYQQLSECNKALEGVLREYEAEVNGKQQVIQDKRSMEAVLPNIFYLSLTNGVPASIELSRFFGTSASFYLFKAPLPLGLNITKMGSGPLQNAFVVQNTVPGGSAEASGMVLPGDVLQAVTVVSDGGKPLGVRTEDFVSTVTAAMNSVNLQQTLVDASFILSTEELANMIKSNAAMGENTDIYIIFERDTEKSPLPAVPLVPQIRRY